MKMIDNLITHVKVDILQLLQDPSKRSEHEECR